MAPEQLMGRADSSSDLYGLGMTLVHLISGKHPDDLKKKRLVIQWSEYQSGLSLGFIEFLTKLCEPHAEDRFKKALTARDALRESEGPPRDLIRQSKSWLTIKTKDDTLKIRGLQVHIRRFDELWKSPRPVFTALGLSLLIFVPMIVEKFVAGELLASMGPSFFLISFFALCVLKVDAINSTLRWGEKSVEVHGLVDKSLLSKSDQLRLDLEVRKFTQRYKEEKTRRLTSQKESKAEEDEKKKS